MQWLEAIRDILAGHFLISLDFTEAELSQKTPWLIVGRFSPVEDINYEILGHALQAVADDLVLEAMIHPQRLSQIRIVFVDPNSKRGEGDSFVSQIGAWEFVVSDMVGEILGGGPEDEGALAVRYERTTIGAIYIYFSSEISVHRTVGPNTNAVKL